MRDAKVKNVDLNIESRELVVRIDVKDSIYIQEPKKGEMGFPQLMNSAPLIEGINLILKHGHVGVDILKENTDSIKGAAEIVSRVKQFLSALDYEDLTDYQAKCALLLEQSIQPNK